MPLDARLLEILACPEDKQPLLYFEREGFLYNPRLKRRYLIEDGVPVMVIDRAVAVSQAEHEQLLTRAAAEDIPPTFR